MKDAAEHELRQTWNRPDSLLIAQPLEGWAPEFKEITRRELGRLAPLGPKQGRDE